MTLAPDTIYLLCLRLDARTCSQSSKSSSRHSGFARKRLVQSSDFLLRTRSVLAHPNCHFRVVCAGGDEFPQCFRIQPAGSKELAIHRTVVVVRTVPADEFCTAFIHQARGHGWKVGERSPRASGSCSVQIERKRTNFFFVHSFAQISSCFGNRDRILQPVLVTKTTSSSRTPPSAG